MANGIQDKLQEQVHQTALLDKPAVALEFHSSNSATPEQSCQAAVFVGAGQPLELRRLPLPELAAGEALIRIECCSVCGSDLHTITGARSERVPSILGHEILGAVEAIGDPAPRDLEGVALKPGDRITWSTVIACGTCDRCQGGLPQKCRTLAKYGHELAEGRFALSGGLSEFLVLRRGSASIRIPDEIPAEVICPANCATATVAAMLRTAGQNSGTISGRSVLILGAGMLGVTAAAMAKAQRASQIVICDRNSQRLERALGFGADRAVVWSAEPNEFRQRLLCACQTDAFDIVLELSGAAEAVEMACALGGVGSQIVLAGSVMKTPPARIDPEQLIRRCQSIHGVHNYTPADLRAAVEFLQRHGGTFPFAELVEQIYPLTEINAAIAAAIETRPFRIAIHP